LLVVLFGSVARGEFTRDSDADVLVVFDRPVDWETVYADREGAVHPVIKTLEQVEEQIREGEPFFVEMIEDGIPLYDSDGLYQRLSRAVQQAKAAWGLERTSFGWQWKNQEPVAV
jgi:hypothetical protein